MRQALQRSAITQRDKYSRRMAMSSGDRGGPDRRVAIQQDRRFLMPIRYPAMRNKCLLVESSVA